MRPWPGWLVLLLFLPLQVWLFFKMHDVWGWWPTIGTFVGISLLATRATRVRGLRALFFPRMATTWERRRILFQAALFLLAGLSFLFSLGPQPWLPAAAAVSLVKSLVR